MFRQTCIHLVTVAAMFSVVGCSAWDGGYRGGVPPHVSDMHSRSITGIYQNLGSDGSIQPHPVTLGTGGQVTGVIKAGGPFPMPDIKTGQMVIRGGSAGPSSSSGPTPDATGSTTRNSENNGSQSAN